MFALLAAARFAHFAGLSLLFGLAAFPFYAGEAPAGLGRVLKASAALALASGVAVMASSAANMGGAFGAILDPSVYAAMIGDTVYGQVWLGRLALAAVALAVSLRSPGKDRVLLVLSALLIASVGLTGHSAMPGGALGAVHEVADALHLLAAGWWIGGLLALILFAGRLGERAAAVLGRFSRIGYGAVAILILSGALKSAILLGAPGALVSTAYGRTLLAKLALFAGMGALALSNRLQIAPALARAPGAAPWLGRLKVQAAAEFALGLAILALVGALGAMAPPISD